ncbi:MAG: tetratricopeptide repeat protein [Bacteroidota bacterium]|nr:tetratricopeptide repeat protein [Bacteroidota bacterium]MDP3144120.1 tetratricopeptide repeat protein [Bacteroidota bacterium]MDP3558157.1 tetratricopeptide repeat protein [Bacteroidota bacterium]
MLTVALIVTCIVYYKFLFFGHISWDDPEMVFKNKFVKEFDIKGLFTNHFVGNYIPITMFTHSIAWLLFENNDGAHHLINLLFHLTNGILVYKIGQRLFKNNSIANIGALIFLLHPMQVESVGWISELKNVLSATFYLAGILSYLNFTETSKTQDYILCLLLFVLGCLSKSSVVIFPITLICLDILIHKKISTKYILNKIPFLLLAILFGIINIKTQTADLFINHAHEFPYYQRIGFAGFALLKYLVLFLLPVNLSVIYPYPEINTSVFAVGYAGILSVALLLFVFIKQKKYQALAIVLFIIANLILVLQLLPFGEVLYADRYMYLPLVGFGWLTGLTISKLKIQTNIIAFVCIIIFSVFSFARGNDWKNALTLYEDINKKYPNQFLVLNSMGVESMFLNEDNKALDYLNMAVSVAPRNYKGFYNRGLLYLKNNQPEQAIKSFNQTLELYNYPKAYIGRASAYYMLGDFPKAINDANYVLELEENNTKAHFILGNCYNDLNRLDDALKEYNKCIEFEKDEAEFYFKRAIVFGKKQDFKNSINQINVCLLLNPNFFEAYYWRGVAKINLKQNACEDFKIAAQNNFQPAVDAFNKYCR